MQIVSRAQWGARAPKRKHHVGPQPRLWIHHFATEAWHGAKGMRDCQNFHMDGKGWSDIAYSFVVDDDGTVFEGRGFGVAGGHTQGDNTESHAICFMGNYENREPTEAACVAAAALVRHGREWGFWSDVTGGHRDAVASGHSTGSGTACAGRYLQARIDGIRWLASVNNSPQEAPRKMDKATADRIVTESYKIALDRGVDPRGLDSWSKALQEGRITTRDLMVDLLKAEGLRKIHARLAKLEASVVELSKASGNPDIAEALDEFRAELSSRIGADWA